ncbi:nucleotide sugar dehydrogenase [Nitrosopumilus sp.]|nr:nucleotide sugar dehydrogenase [Nitrosopumilus sp.]
MKLNENELIQSIQSGDLSVCVIGIGRIGLPTALSFANSGLSTVGVDINTELVEMINSKIFPLKDEPGYDVIFEKVTNQKFNATTKIEDIVPKSDVVILSLPTPMDKNNVPDYSALLSVGKQLGQLLSNDALVIVESTVEPGFIENDLINVIENSDKKLAAGKDFAIGVCPETANPGQIMNDFEKLPRLVGAIDEKTKNAIMKIYKHVFTVDLIPMPNCKTANAVKLTTNVFRDLNIAFVNELAILFEKVGIDIMTVLDAAKTKYNFQVHYPGPGVGGPCLPVNAYQMINLAKNMGFDTLKSVEMGRTINESMPMHVIDLLSDAFIESKKPLENSNILVLGISYKPDVKDIQISPAEIIIEKLKNLKTNVLIYDPYFKSTNVFNLQTESNLIEALQKSDALILVTAHKEFHNLDPIFLKSKMKNAIVIDSKCIINQQSAKNAGLVYRGLGRGKI